MAEFLLSRRHTGTEKQPFIYSYVIRTRIVAGNQYAVSLLDPGYNRIVIGDQITGKIPTGYGVFYKRPPGHQYLHAAALALTLFSER